MNVYSHNLHTSVDFLFNKALNISNLLYIEEDCNVRDAKLNSFVSLHSIASQILRDLANSYSLVCSILALCIPTYYLDI